MDETKKTRFYSWDLMTYMDEGNLLRCLKENARNWAYILHDSDIDEDGNPKTPHRHVVATFDREKSFNQIGLMFDSYAQGQNTRKRPIDDIASCLLYLTHETEKAKTEGKFQYDRRKVVLSNQDFYDKYVKGGEVTTNDTFVDDLLAQDFDPIAMGRKYGRDFIKNFKHYVAFRVIATKQRLIESYLSKGYQIDYETGEYIHVESGQVMHLSEIKTKED